MSSEAGVLLVAGSVFTNANASRKVPRTPDCGVYGTIYGNNPMAQSSFSGELVPIVPGQLDQF
jgi:hypothetical protein